MKKRQNNSARASALQITLSVALLSVSAVLFASSFRGAPAALKMDSTHRFLLPQRLSSLDSTRHFQLPHQKHQQERY